MRKILATGLLAMGMVMGLAPAPARAAAPSGWVRHVDAPWTWYAPRGWIAAHGANDLNISSPTGALWNKYGASAAPTVTPQQWFSYESRTYIATAKFGPGLYSRTVTGARITAIDKQVHVSQSYWRQRFTFTAMQGRTPIDGEMVFDYFFVNGSGDAGEIQQIRAAPRAGRAASLATLRTVQKLIFYCGSVC